MPYLNSSAIDRVEYDPQTRELRIWFRPNGGPYSYYGVPQHIYDGLLRAPSAGSYFNDHIKDRYGS